MKRFLLILIYLFVSFEVKSKEIVLNCKITKKTEGGFGSKIKEREIEYHSILPQILYFDVKNKWLYNQKRDDYFEFNKIRLERGEIEFTFDESDKYYFFQTKNENTDYTQTVSVRLDRYSGYFHYQMMTSLEDGPKREKKSHYGECEKVKKKLF